MIIPVHSSHMNSSPLSHYSSHMFYQRGKILTL